jgi:hypothetical protein
VAVPTMGVEHPNGCNKDVWYYCVPLANVLKSSLIAQCGGTPVM